MFFAVCRVPITGEQYVNAFDDQASLEAYLVDNTDDVSYVIEGIERDPDDFLKLEQ